ncbi:hypothetical protein V8C86DRAFT_589367 [Haematococcus lacustris]
MQRDRKGFSGNLSLVLERAQALQQLQQQRAVVLKRLELLLSHKQLAVQQAEQLHAAASNVEENKQRVSRGRSQLRQVKEHTKKLQQELQLRRNVAEQRAASLARQRLAHCSVVLPQDLRTHELASLHARMGLLGEQRVKVLQLLDILPLRLEGMRAPALTSRAAAGAAASAALALPSRAAAGSVAQHPGGGPGGVAPHTPSTPPHAQLAAEEPEGGADAQFLLHPPPSHHHHHPPHHHHHRHHHHYHLDHRHPPQQQQQHRPAPHPPMQPVEQDGGSQGGGRPLASQQSWHGRPVSHSCGSGSGRLVGRQQQEAGSFGPMAPHSPAGCLPAPPPPGRCQRGRQPAWGGCLCSPLSACACLTSCTRATGTRSPRLCPLPWATCCCCWTCCQHTWAALYCMKAHTRAPPQWCGSSSPSGTGAPAAAWACCPCLWRQRACWEARPPLHLALRPRPPCGPRCRSSAQPAACRH